MFYYVVLKNLECCEFKINLVYILNGFNKDFIYYLIKNESNLEKGFVEMFLYLDDKIVRVFF